MAKAQRLIELMITINAKKDFTVGELAKEFCVSKRTILRDLQELEEAGFPLYSEVGAAGGYHIVYRSCSKKTYLLTKTAVLQQYAIRRNMLIAYAQLSLSGYMP